MFCISRQFLGNTPFARHKGLYFAPYKNAKGNVNSHAEQFSEQRTEQFPEQRAEQFSEQRAEQFPKQQAGQCAEQRTAER